MRKLTSQEIISSLSLEEKAILLQGKTTWETYAVKQAGIIMSSYNMVNGQYANENAHLLDDILRKEWGFDGFVVTDWGGDNDHTEGVCAGSNLPCQPLAWTVPRDWWRASGAASSRKKCWMSAWVNCCGWCWTRMPP